MSLYHYTDLNAVISIIESKTMRLTDINYLNDSQELHDGLEAIRKEIQSLEDSSRYKNDAYLSSSLDQIKGSFTTGENSLSEVVQLFTCSFSANKDQLSQWRGYGPYCIEFDQEKLSKIEKVHRCLYEPNEKQALAVEMTDAAAENISMELQAIEKGYLTPVTYSVLGDLLTKAATFKEQGFKEEGESRWISWDTSKIEYRTRGNQLIPFIKIDIPLDCIKSVIIGPMRDQKLAEKALRSYMDNKGFQIEVQVSKIPFRTG